MTGFDIETTKLVAAKLGVEACFVSPTWTEATAGNWNDRMDIVYGSGAINATRMEHLWMTQPYYYVPQRFVVRKDSRVPEAVRPRRQDDRDVHQLHGRVVPQGHAQDPRRRPRPEGQGPEARGLRDRVPGHRSPGRGRHRRVPDRRARRAAGDRGGRPLRILDETAFSMYPSGFVDKGSSLS